MQDGIELAARIFVSYAHDDNDLLDGAVQEFCADLKTYFNRDTGRDLDVFFDRDSIGWGGDWRSELYGSLFEATIFMPIVTMIYFTRDACRDELNAFHAAANRLGARYLILPVLIAGGRSITEDHPMPEVRLIESLQYVDLQKPFLAGRKSREWREAMHEVAEKLAEIVERAEREIGRASPSAPAGTSAHAGTSAPAGTAGRAESDLIEDMQKLEELAPQVQRDVERTGAAITAWGAALQQDSAGEIGSMSRDQMRAYCLRLAERIGAPSAALYEATAALARTAQEADVLIRGFVTSLSAIDVPEVRASADRVMQAMGSDPEGLQAVSDQMTEFLNRLQLMEMMSMPLRQAIRPARYGIRELQDTLRIVQGWSQIADTPSNR